MEKIWLSIARRDILKNLQLSAQCTQVEPREVAKRKKGEFSGYERMGLDEIVGIQVSKHRTQTVLSFFFVKKFFPFLLWPIF